MSRRDKLEQVRNELIEQYMEDISTDKKSDAVERALERALEDTTPDRAGSPWSNKPNTKTESEWFDA